MDSPDEIAQLKQAIDCNDLARVKALMLADPELHRAPMGYGKDGPLTWVAECRVPWEPPGEVRLAIAKWMLENGSDIHQGGDGPLMRAALRGDRIPMMELLVSYGADVNARWHGRFPIIFAPCETLQPKALKWLLEHGAVPGTALDYVIGTYSRAPKELNACLDILLEAGAPSKYDVPSVMAILRGRTDLLAQQIDADPTLISRRFPELDFGSTGGRVLTLKGATLLHVAAEYGTLDAAELLLDRGTDVNARATVCDDGIGGQTAIFHAATQFEDHGLAVAKLLLARGADLSIRAKLPGHYGIPGETVECTPLGYARLFPGTPNLTLECLLAAGAAE